MKKSLLLLLPIPFTTISAQEKMLTTENCVFANRDGLTPQRLTQLNWIIGTVDYYFIDKTSGTETLVRSKASEKGTAKKVIDLNELNDLLRKINITGVTVQASFPSITWTSASTFSFEIEKSVFVYSTSTKKLSASTIKLFPNGAENFDATKGDINIAFTVDNNLFIKHKTNSTEPSGDGTKILTVSDDKDINIVNGKSVHREEFGISKGTFWSPDGNLLAYYKMDQTMVTDYPIMDLTKQPAQARMIKYPMAGGTSHQVIVMVYNVANGKTVHLKTEGPKDQYLTNISWSPDNKFVYIAVLNRDQNHLWLNRYSAETGAFDKTLFEETDPKYVHPMHPMEFVTAHSNEFIWQRQLCSAENPYGLNEIILFNTDGKLLQHLTLFPPNPNAKFMQPGNVTDVYGCDLKGDVLYFQASPINTCEKALYSVTLHSTAPELKKLSNEIGTHTGIFSDDKKYYIDTYSNVDIPCIQSIYDNSGKQIKILLMSANPLVNIAPNVRLDMNYFKGSNRIKLFTIKSADGETELWCRMILPSNFDSTKKYRTMTYVYNGPNVQLVTNSWIGGADYFQYYMAQQGFVVFTVDGRGSDNRGMKFEQATFQHLGNQEMADQEKGNQYLRSLKYVDATRMSVFGWSFGGFMTTSLMTRKPDLYKCGVAGGPVIDWSYYEIMYTERYMDTPQTNPLGYKEACLTNYAGSLKGKLMQIHGTSDDVVVWQHSLLFQKACVDKNVQCDYYVYPGHLHNVRGKDRVNLYDKISQYIISNT